MSENFHSRPIEKQFGVKRKRTELQTEAEDGGLKSADLRCTANPRHIDLRYFADDMCESCYLMSRAIHTSQKATQ